LYFFPPHMSFHGLQWENLIFPFLITIIRLYDYNVRIAHQTISGLFLLP
jgi:hypothetical protein